MHTAGQERAAHREKVPEAAGFAQGARRLAQAVLQEIGHGRIARFLNRYRALERKRVLDIQLGRGGGVHFAAR